MLRALDAAHRADIVHRDVKPANIMLTADHEVVLTDFGIAVQQADTALTNTGAFLGSVEYIAPERARGTDGLPISDLFSLGVTLYHAVEGFSPFHRETATGSLTAVLFEEAPAPKRAGTLKRLITGLMEKDSDQRLNHRAGRDGARPAGRPHPAGNDAQGEHCAADDGCGDCGVGFRRIRGIRPQLSAASSPTGILRSAVSTALPTAVCRSAPLRPARDALPALSVLPAREPARAQPLAGPWVPFLWLILGMFYSVVTIVDQATVRYGSGGAFSLMSLGYVMVLVFISLLRRGRRIVVRTLGYVGAAFFAVGAVVDALQVQDALNSLKRYGVTAAGSGAAHWILPVFAIGTLAFYTWLERTTRRRLRGLHMAAWQAAAAASGHPLAR